MFTVTYKQKASAKSVCNALFFTVNYVRVFNLTIACNTMQNKAALYYANALQIKILQAQNDALKPHLEVGIHEGYKVTIKQVTRNVVSTKLVQENYPEVALACTTAQAYNTVSVSKV